MGAVAVAAGVAAAVAAAVSCLAGAVCTPRSTELRVRRTAVRVASERPTTDSADRADRRERSNMTRRPTERESAEQTAGESQSGTKNDWAADHSIAVSE